ncbi:MAG: hypothetical protein GXO76_06575, partial [Calditrichaeota bacterium]|nr:hypothetical protein [Calditrichota bacterium]
YEKNFTLTDTTTGNYWYNGPIIQAIYSRKLPLNFSLGIAFNYTVQLGLKDVYTKVESIRRTIFPGVGLSWGVQTRQGQLSRHPSSPENSFSERTGLKYGAGVFIYPYDNKTRLTAVKEMRDAVVYRQIGLLTRFREVRGKYIRDYRTKGVLIGGQVFLALSQAVHFGFSNQYRAFGTTATDNLFVKRGYEQHIQNTTLARMVFRKHGWQMSTQVLRESFDGWSKTIEYGCLYGEESRQRITAGIGIGTNRMWLPITMGVEVYGGRFQRTYRDYLSHQFIENRQPEWELRAGLEFPVFSDAWRLRLGGNWSERVPDLLYLYEREKLWKLTSGLSWRASGFRLSLLGTFRSRIPDGAHVEIGQPLHEMSPFIPTGHRQRVTFQIILQLFEK